jgi:hypothetical protein
MNIIFNIVLFVLLQAMGPGYSNELIEGFIHSGE